MHTRQNGFTVIESLLVILILAIIGFGGYFVWNTSQKDDTETATATSTTKTTDKAVTKTTEPAPLIIKELGIELPLTSEISDMTYEQGANQSVVVVSSPLLMQSAVQDNPTQCGDRAEKDYPIGIITTDTMYSRGDVKAQTTINGKVYYWSLPGAGSGCNYSPTSKFSDQAQKYYSNALASFKESKSIN